MKIINGSWELDLGGICYKEMYELGRLLTQLGEKGNIGGEEFDLETLHAKFNANTGEVDLYDGEDNTTEEKTYKIVRFYEEGGYKVIKEGLTLDEAKEHCNDPETSSYTAQAPNGCAEDEELISQWHKEHKHWFDGFEEE